MNTIAVIDDDDATLDSLTYLLEDAGYDVVTAENSSIIEQQFHGKVPHLILIDYCLPKENGGEITKRLKINIQTKHIPIIITSASYNIEKLFKQTDADDFLEKPYDINVLLKKIQRHILI